MKRFFHLIAPILVVGLSFTGCDMVSEPATNTGTFASLVDPADDIDALCEAVPLDIVGVLDRSGSMGLIGTSGQTKLQEVQNASKDFIDRLNSSSDRVGLVSYAATASVDEGLTDDFATVKGDIDALTASGNTNIREALEDGLSVFAASPRPEATPIMILLTNGQPTVGGDPLPAAQDVKDAGIRLITIAFGSTANATLLEDMASEPKASNFFVADGDTVDEIFETISREICPTPVRVDIKPGSDPNSINLRRNGVTAVAVFSTDDFDATTIDPSTVRFGALDDIQGGGGALLAHEGGHLEDVNGDGMLDFVGHFATQDSGFEIGDEFGYIVGETDSGESFAGRDAVRLIGKPSA